MKKPRASARGFSSWGIRQCKSLLLRTRARPCSTSKVKPYSNVTGTAFVRRAAQDRPFVHVSSLSAREPQFSTYGWSKLAGEQIARGAEGPVAAVRPPGVYGPGDREFLELMRTARTGFIPMPKASAASQAATPSAPPPPITETFMKTRAGRSEKARLAWAISSMLYT